MTSAENNESIATLARRYKTIRDLIRHASTMFERARLTYGHGTSNAHDEAFALLCGALALNPEQIEHYLDATLSEHEVTQILTLCERRVKERQPMAYLTGQMWLLGLAFKSDQRALVPRALLVEAMKTSFDEYLGLFVPDTAQAMADEQWPARVLDLCTGGGSIAIHAARQFPNAEVVAADLSEKALTLCAENIALHQLEHRIQTASGDLFLATDRQRFDLICCNPPYVPERSMRSLPAEYRAEPVLALAGGNDGMDLVKTIIAQAANHLTDDGVLLLEIGHEANAFEQVFNDLEFSWLAVEAGETMVLAVSAQQLRDRQQRLS